MVHVSCMFRDPELDRASSQGVSPEHFLVIEVDFQQEETLWQVYFLLLDHRAEPREKVLQPPAHFPNPGSTREGQRVQRRDCVLRLEPLWAPWTRGCSAQPALRAQPLSSLSCYDPGNQHNSCSQGPAPCPTEWPEHSRVIAERASAEIPSSSSSSISCTHGCGHHTLLPQPSHSGHGPAAACGGTRPSGGDRSLRGGGTGVLCSVQPPSPMQGSRAPRPPAAVPQPPCPPRPRALSIRRVLICWQLWAG